MLSVSSRITYIIALWAAGLAALGNGCAAPSSPPAQRAVRTAHHRGHAPDAHAAHNGVQRGPAQHRTAQHRRGEHNAQKVTGQSAGQRPSHRFDDAARWAKRFEDPKRDAWQKPAVVLKAMALAKGDLVADIGSATGYFPVRIAPHVKKVYGVDIAPSMVSYLNDRAAREGLTNLVSILGTEASAQLPEPVNVALIVNTYHHIEERVAYFRDLALLSGGRLVVVDFKPDDNPPFGPPPAMRLATRTVQSELLQAGFSLVSIDSESLEHQYIVIAQK